MQQINPFNFNIVKGSKEIHDQDLSAWPVYPRD